MSQAALTDAKILNDEERQALLASLERHRGERDSLLIRFMLYTAARSIEVVGNPKEGHPGLLAGSLSAGKATLRGAKGSNDRSIPLPVAYYKELMDYVARAGIKPDERVFPIGLRHYRRIWDTWRPASEKKGHAMRHTMATLLYLESKNILMVKKLLGHASVQNTMVYLEYVDGSQGMRTQLRNALKRSIDVDSDAA